MRITSIIFLFLVLSLASAFWLMPMVDSRSEYPTDCGLIEEVIGSGSSERTYGGGDLVSIKIEIPEDGWVTFEIDDEDGDILLVESREVSEGIALLEFRLEEDASKGIYTVYTTLKTVDGESRELENTEFRIDPEERIPFIWILALGFLLLLVVGLVANQGRGGKASRTRDRPIDKNKGIPDSHMSEQSMMRQKTSEETDEYATWASPPTSPSTPQSPMIPQPRQSLVKQEIHHHYAPQYDQSVKTVIDNSKKTENIVDSVYYRKNK